MKVRVIVAAMLVFPALAWQLSGQLYRELTIARDRPSAFASVLELQAGLLAGLTTDEDPAISLENTLGWDAYALYHSDSFTERKADLNAYAGRDGAYFGVTEGSLGTEGSQNRLEVSMRYFPFYREGFYRSSEFVPTGQYRGKDIGVQLSTARELSTALRLEVGGYYRYHTYSRTAQTASNYIVPGNYNALGVRAWIESNTVVLDRFHGRPVGGMSLTLVGEREQNDQGGDFGVAGTYESQLPSGLWRGYGMLKWYIPQAQGMTWEVFVDGQLTDKKDRIYNADAQKPIGYMWADGYLRFRLDFSDSFAVAPFVRGQFVRVLDESSQNTDQEFFYGGGLDARFEFSESVALVGYYSYLTNDSREPVSTSHDSLGDHRVFIGFQVRLGATPK